MEGLSVLFRGLCKDNDASDTLKLFLNWKAWEGRLKVPPTGSAVFAEVIGELKIPSIFCALTHITFPKDDCYKVTLLLERWVEIVWQLSRDLLFHSH